MTKSQITMQLLASKPGPIIIIINIVNIGPGELR